MISEIINILANFVVSTIDFMGYPGVFLLMLIESCGILMPSEIIMPFSGFLVADGFLNFWLVAFLGGLGNLAGSLLAYWIGWKGGRPLIERYGRYILINKKDLNTADKWFSKHGEITTFIGRLLPVVRTFISFPAGIAQMNLKKFAVYTFAGAFIWSVGLAFAGVKMGAKWDLIREKMHNFDLSIGIIIVILIVLYVWRHVKHSRDER